MDRQKGIAIRKTLDQIGVKHSLKGHRYMISAIEKGLDDRSKDSIHQWRVSFS